MPLVRKGVFVRNMHIQNKPSNYSLRKAYSEKLRNLNKVNETKSKKKVTEGPASYAVKIDKTFINQDLKKRLNKSKKERKNKNTLKVQSVKCNRKTAEDCENNKKLEELTAMIRK